MDLGQSVLSKLSGHFPHSLCFLWIYKSLRSIDAWIILGHNEDMTTTADELQAALSVALAYYSIFHSPLSTNTRAAILFCIATQEVGGTVASSGLWMLSNYELYDERHTIMQREGVQT